MQCAVCTCIMAAPVYLCIYNCKLLFPLCLTDHKHTTATGQHWKCSDRKSLHPHTNYGYAESHNRPFWMGCRVSFHLLTDICIVDKIACRFPEFIVGFATFAQLDAFTWCYVSGLFDQSILTLKCVCWYLKCWPWEQLMWWSERKAVSGQCRYLKFINHKVEITKNDTIIITTVDAQYTTWSFWKTSDAVNTKLFNHRTCHSWSPKPNLLC